ncbi:hypothetical protein JL09_g5686 [Pichia kudriavzevii]|uniref:Uncharacterized protein n=1 Tax=Pichia kudriavzevii TaxID=4909 RepID=A0A099NSZ5_PICKU|nr:hypothetical protein JL09_g5686 [Pichia kudriavzevii]
MVSFKANYSTASFMIELA